MKYNKVGAVEMGELKIKSQTQTASLDFGEFSDGEK